MKNNLKYIDNIKLLLYNIVSKLMKKIKGGRRMFDELLLWLEDLKARRKNVVICFEGDCNTMYYTVEADEIVLEKQVLSICCDNIDIHFELFKFKNIEEDKELNGYILSSDLYTLFLHQVGLM